MLEAVPVSFVFQHMVSVVVLESVLDRSPSDSLDNVQTLLRGIHGSDVPRLLFDEDHHNQ